MKIFKSFVLIVALLGGFLGWANIGYATDKLIGEGVFIGASNHATSGKVSVHKQGDKVIVTLKNDFYHDGAPDPKLGFFPRLGDQTQ